MSKKVVVITGSPRKNGNSFAMTDSFIQAARAKGHSVTRFDAAMMQIGGCRACETCFSTEKPAPLTTTSTKSPRPFCSRCHCFYHAGLLVFQPRPDQRGDRPDLFPGGGGKDISGKECALIACCEEEDLSVLDGVRIPMERTAALNKWTMVGEVLVPGVLKPGTSRKQTAVRERPPWPKKSEKGGRKHGKEYHIFKRQSPKKRQHLCSGGKVYPGGPESGHTVPNFSWVT